MKVKKTKKLIAIADDKPKKPYVKKEVPSKTQELYNKYRPASLDDIIGNESTVSSLKSVLSRDNPPRAFLFLGPAGCGKTSLAYLVRDAVGCDPDMDFHEIDSGHFGGVDFIRDIRDMMRHTPQHGKFNVWFFDECHNLSSQAQDALLKELEDGAPSTILILATTEESKVKKTIRSRCAEYWVDALTESQLGKMMWDICQQEGKKVPKEVIKRIAIDCLGSARTALSVLDSVIDMPKSEMMKAAERKAEEESQTIELCRALVKGDSWSTVAQVLSGLKDDPEKTRRAVLGYCQSILLKGGGDISKRAAFIMSIFSDNLFNTGKPGLVLMCYEVYFDLGD